MHRKALIAAFALWPLCTPAQVLMQGRLLIERFPGSADKVPLSAVFAFASLRGSESEALGFRTWETHPAGWYRLSGGAGNYTIAFSSPAHYMRPILLTNVYARNGERIDLTSVPRFDLAEFFDGAWDTKPARSYCQTFIAGGSSVTHVGLKLATDGVDGGGPGSRNLLVSIHRRGPGAPETWEQIGPTALVRDVDCGGPKNYWFSAGWNSGEVPTETGKGYAVHLRAEEPGGTFQAFWRETEDPGERCFRRGEGEEGFLPRRLWLAVASDCDGLVIPYNKRVHKKFHELSRFASKWSQTYVAAGRGLAAVILFAATSGVQPPLSRQRVLVRLRRGGPDGEPVGITKIAVGSGNYTGDASWGVFGAAFAPGEVPLVPGERYALEFESIEHYATLHGFVNIKGQISDDRPGFNPYRKCTPDAYEGGEAYYMGREPVDYDLDMQVIEYRFPGRDWENGTAGSDLLAEGGEKSKSPEMLSAERIAGWRALPGEPGTLFQRIADEKAGQQGILRIAGSSKEQKVDGVYVRRVAGLSAADTYRLSGDVRSSWPLSVDHACMVGFDPTGQADDPAAGSIAWTPLPLIHGAFVPYLSEPIRPREDAISVWLRARSSNSDLIPFTADFDDFSLRRVNTGVPGPP